MVKKFVPGIAEAMVVLACCIAAGQKAKAQQWDIQSVEREYWRVSGKTPIEMVKINANLNRFNAETFQRESNALTLKGYEPFSTTAAMVFKDDNDIYLIRSEVWYRRLQ